MYTQFPPFDSYVYACLTTYAWIGPVVTRATYLGTELLIPRKYRKFFHFPAWILLIACEVLIFIGPNSYLYPITETEILGDTSFKLFSPPFFLMMFYALFLTIFVGSVFLIRAIQTGGVLGEKFIILSLGIFLMIFELNVEGIQDVGKSIAFVLVLRILMIVGLLLLNYGLTPTKKKRKFETPA